VNQSLLSDLIWSSYYGGSLTDEGRSIAFDSDENVYLTGYTLSIADTFDIATPQFATTMDANWDSFIVKFSPNGNRIWGRYYGGEDYDQAYAIAYDSNNFLVLCGTTGSTNGIALNGYDNIKSGYWDGFISKFDTSGNLVWGTYYGCANNSTMAFSLVTDGNGNIYITGYTECQNASFTLNAFQSTSYGVNLFILKFDPSCVRIWCTYYFGQEWDYLSNISIDSSNNIYIGGRTLESGLGFGGFQENKSLTYDAIITKFDSRTSTNFFYFHSFITNH